MLGLVTGGVTAADSLAPAPTQDRAASATTVTRDNSSAYVSTGLGAGATSSSAALGVRSLGATLNPDPSARTLVATSTSYAVAFFSSSHGADQADVDPVTANCLTMPAGGDEDAWYVDGRTVDCPGGDRTFTITFDTPVVDPVLMLASGSLGTANSPTPAACYVTWNDISIDAINGTDAATYQIDRNDFSGNGSAAYPPTIDFTDNTFRTTPHAGDCFDYPLGSPTVPGVRITGVVSAITITASQMAMLQKQGAKSCSLQQCTDGTFQRAWSVANPGIQVSVRLPRSDVSIAKSGPATMVAGNKIEWSIAVTNNAEFDTHGYVVKDVVPDPVSDATLVSGPAGCVLTDRELRCAAEPTGWSVDDTSAVVPILTGGDPAAPVPSVLAAGATSDSIVLRGTVTGSAGDVVTNTATVSTVDYDPDETNNAATASTALVAPAWSVSKSVSLPNGARYASPGDTITYHVTATNVGTTDVTTAVLIDDLTGVLASADFVAGSAQLTIGTGAPTTLSDPSPVLTTGAFTLPSGQAAVMSYQVVVHTDAWSARLDNTVVGEGSSPPGTCATGVTPVAEQCQTHTVVTARLDILKRGTVNGQVVALDGADFEVLTDVGGTAGTPTGLSVKPLTVTGTFEIADVAPGTYWLRETAAPAGHDLLVQAVRFTVDVAGTVTLTEPDAHPQVTTAGGQLVVTDSPRFDLPTTGGSGTGAFIGLGLVLLVGTGAQLGYTARRHRTAP